MSIEYVVNPDSGLEDRYVPDYKELQEKVDACKKLKKKIVLTAGTYDIFHVGHSRYFRQAKKHGDVLVVGIDSDAKVRSRKGPNRPLVPEMERVEIVCDNRYVDFVTIKDVNHEHHELLRMVRPDVLIVSESTKHYTPEEIEERKKYCKEVIVLPPQATTSTSAQIRILMLGLKVQIKCKLEEMIRWLEEQGAL